MRHAAHNVFHTMTATHLGRRSRIWSAVFRAGYAWLRVVDPLLRWTWRQGGMGITAELGVRGRRSGRRRTVLAGLLFTDGKHFVGHPNGPAQWTRNLAATREISVRLPGQAPFVARVTRLAVGDPQRSAAIDAAGRQQPWPANWLYTAAWRHIEEVGDYFRLEVG